MNSSAHQKHSVDYGNVLENARIIHKELRNILRYDLETVAYVSLKICEEVIIHFLKDMKRLEGVQPNGVHASKHIGYMAFWIRKLKPVSKAFKESDINRFKISYKKSEFETFHSVEITDINEQVSLFFLARSLLKAMNQGKIDGLPSGPQDSGSFSAAKKSIYSHISSYIDLLEQSDETPKSVPIIYDMRFRTFGPHHMVTLVNQTIRIAKSDLGIAAT